MRFVQPYIVEYHATVTVAGGVFGIWVQPATWRNGSDYPFHIDTLRANVFDASTPDAPATMAMNITPWCMFNFRNLSSNRDFFPNPISCACFQLGTYFRDLVLDAPMVVEPDGELVMTASNRVANALIVIAPATYAMTVMLGGKLVDRNS